MQRPHLHKVKNNLKKVLPEKQDFFFAQKEKKFAKKRFFWAFFNKKNFYATI
jgi:hypothetical protein